MRFRGECARVAALRDICSSDRLRHENFGSANVSRSPRCEQQKKLQGDALNASVQPAQGGTNQHHVEAPVAKKRKVIARVPTWPNEAADSRNLSPSISPLVTPRGELRHSGQSTCRSYSGWHLKLDRTRAGRLSDESLQASDGLTGCVVFRFLNHHRECQWADVLLTCCCCARSLSPLPSPIPAITPRARAAAHIVANMRNTNAGSDSMSLAT